VTLGWPASQPSLTDHRVRLRAWARGDADAVFRACQDPQIQRSIPIPVPYAEKDAVDFVSGYATDRWATQAGAPFAVTDAGSGELLGSCGLVSVDAANLVAEAGYWTAPWARGRGVAGRAVRLLADWALSEGGLARLEFYVEPGNLASRRVAERLGCRPEGVLRSKALVRGTRRDMILYALVRP
jgi:RimJ/RimL family protein N-acetyltransferase